MVQHIGIVGCSAEGAALCYRTICIEGPGLLGEHAHPEVSMHTPSLAAYVACLDAGDVWGVGDLMLKSADKLAAAGADFLICPDNTVHQAFDYVAERSPLPWLHIAETVAAEARRRQFKTVALTGTKWLVQSGVYSETLARHGIECIRPPEAALTEMNRIIMDELVYGVCKQASIEQFREWIDVFRQSGCEAVILGCTEIPLIINDANAALPTLDSTRLIARAALRHAIDRAH